MTPTDKGKQGLDEATMTLWRDSMPPDASAEDSIRTEQDTYSSVGKSRPRPRSIERSEDSPSDFMLGDKLGSGGMGVVYAANQTAFGRDVAVKMVKPSRRGSTAAADALLAEAVVTGHLEHPNVIPVYDLGIDAEGNLFYAMKEVHGDPWSKLLAKKSLDENLDILLRVADTVSFAHARGIIHRDLKPHNIMLGEFGEVMVMDWGASCAVGEEAFFGALSAESSFCGTPAYMPPEMARCDSNRQGPASDVYLLGAMLYHIICGHPPRREKDPALCLNLASENVIEPWEQDGELGRIAIKAMAELPNDRFLDVRGFQNAIRDYRSHSESLLLLESAKVNLTRARQKLDYDLFNRAIYGFREALELWIDNTEAETLRQEAVLDYARCAFDNADFELAQSLLDSHDPVHRELIDLVRKAIRDRDVHKRRSKHFRLTAQILGGFLLLFFLLAFLLIRGEQKKTKERHRESLANLIAAHFGQQNYEATISAFWQLYDQYGMDALDPETLLDVRVAAAMNPWRGSIQSGVNEPLGIEPSADEGCIWVVGKNELKKMRLLPETGYEPETTVRIHDFEFGKRKTPGGVIESVTLPTSLLGSEAMHQAPDGTLWIGSGSILYSRRGDEWDSVLDISQLDIPPLPEEYNIDRAAVKEWMEEKGRHLPIVGIKLNRDQTHAAVALGASTVCWVDLKNKICLGWFVVGHGTFFETLLSGTNGARLVLSPDEQGLVYQPFARGRTMVFSFRLPGMVREVFTYNRDYPVRAVSFPDNDRHVAIGLNGNLYAPDEVFLEKFEPEIFRLAEGSGNGNRWGPEYCLVRTFNDSEISLAAFADNGQRCCTYAQDGTLYVGSASRIEGFHASRQIVDRNPVACRLLENDRVLLLAENGELHRYDLEEHSVAALPLDFDVNSISKGSCSNELLVSSSNEVLRLEVEPDGTLLPEYLISVKNNGIAIDPSGRYLAIVDAMDGKVFDLASKEQQLGFKSCWSFSSPWIDFSECGEFMYYGGDWKPGLRVYQTGTWTNLLSITYHNSDAAHFTDVVLDDWNGDLRLLYTRGGPKEFECHSINADTLTVSTNWIQKTGSSPMAIIPFCDPENGERNYWCKLWFQDFQLYDAASGEQSRFHAHWKLSGLGHPVFISKDPRVLFPMENGTLQITLKSDLYPIFDPRALDFKVEQAVLNSDASRLYLLGDGQLHCMKLK